MENIIETEKYRDIQGFQGLYKISNLGNIKSLKSNGKILKPGHTTRGYLRVGLRKDNKTNWFFVHVLVAKAFPEICGEWFKGCEVDHIDTDPLNNRVHNLRVCTRNENCNNSLTIKHHKSAAVKRWQDQNIREKIIESMKNAYIDPEIKERNKRLTKEYYSNPENRKKILERSKEYWNKPGSKEKRSKTSKKYWSDPKNRKEYGKKISKPVYQLDKYTGKKIQKWQSAKEVEKVLGICRTSVGKCCRGIIKTSGGYKWEFAE